MKHLRIQLLILLACLSATYFVSAESYVVGVEDLNYSPYYRTENGIYLGFAREFIDAFGEAYGYEFEFRPMPIPRLYKSLIGGMIDFKFPDHPSWGKEPKSDHQIYYSEGLVSYIDGIIVKEIKQTNQISDLSVVGYVRGFSPYAIMDLIKKGKLKTRETNSLESLMRLLRADRIEGAYFNIKVAFHLGDINKEGKAQFRFAETLPHHQSSYRMSSMLHKSILEEMSRFTQSEKAKAIYLRYGLTQE